MRACVHVCTCVCLQHGEESDEDGAEASDHATPHHGNPKAASHHDHGTGGQHYGEGPAEALHVDEEAAEADEQR